MKIINQQLLDEITAAAKENPRLRKNWNLHPADNFPAHRLLNAMEPQSYIRPHRHLEPLKDETFMIVRGRLGILVFADDGKVKEKLLQQGSEGVGGTPEALGRTVAAELLKWAKLAKDANIKAE